MCVCVCVCVCACACVTQHAVLYRKTAIAIDTIINQKRFNDADEDSKFHCLFSSKMCCICMYREEAVLYLCGHRSEEKYCGSDCQATQ